MYVEGIFFSCSPQADYDLKQNDTSISELYFGISICPKLLPANRIYIGKLADAILEALQVAENGLTRKQIRDLFHGHVSSGSIDQALEKLSSLGVATSPFISGRGPLTTLWSAVDHEYAEQTEEEAAEPGEYPEEET